jgi:hypothetical protein
MAEYLYNQGGVTIDANGVRRHADGSSDTLDQSMLRGLTNPSMGSGSLAGINFNGGLSPTHQNYDNTSDPFSAGYGTPNQSAGNGQPFPTQAPAANPWQANTKPQSVGGFAGALGGGNASPYPMNGGVPQAMQSNMQGGLEVNPYLSTMGANLTNEITSNFNRNVMPGMRSQMMADGGIGGSREGVLQANALRDMNSTIGNALGNLYGQGYVQAGNQRLGEGNLQLGYGNLGRNINNDNLNYGLGVGNLQLGYGNLGRNINNDYLNHGLGVGHLQLGYGNLGRNINNDNLNYGLGVGNLQLGYGNLDRNINNDNLNWQLQGANFGLGLQDRLNNSNAIGLGAGLAIQDTPLNYYSNFADRANAIGQGFASTSQSGGGGSALTGALGGAQLGNQIGNWWNTRNQPNRGTDAWSGTNPSTWFNTGSLAD